MNTLQAMNDYNWILQYTDKIEEKLEKYQQFKKVVKIKYIHKSSLVNEGLIKNHYHKAIQFLQLWSKKEVLILG